MSIRSHVWLSVFGIITIFLSHGNATAQIPNAGFENWTGGEPDGWYTANSPGLITITQSSAAHGGSSAAQGTVVTFMTFGIAPILITGTADAEGFPISQRYAALHGFYKYAPTGGDRVYATITVSKNGSGIGSGGAFDSVTYSSYREFVIPITYITSDVPDTAVIYFSILGPGGLPHSGSSFSVDDLSFGAVTGINDARPGIPASFALSANYPNPFNPSTSIGYDLPEEAHVRLIVTDVTGRTVANLVNEQQPAGRYKAVFDASGFSSGIYFYTIRTEKWNATNRMLLMK
jgi:hypothetical protein